VNANGLFFWVLRAQKLWDEQHYVLRQRCYRIQKRWDDVEWWIDLGGEA
jgi:hypothetical protein